MDDIRELWNETPEKNWSALHNTIRQHKGKARGIEDNLVDQLTRITRELEDSGHSFPDSPQKLYEVLNERLKSTAHS
ncbi:MAG TPA: hypothetical protein DEP84_03670 [Chloroflexi bacterium]|nr:hypothetical protein [Chloroflexota bacterium]